MTTRVPTTRANLLFYTGAPGRKIDRWLDALTHERDGRPALLEVDSDDDGELIWKVRGAQRAAGGTDKVEEALRLDELQRDVRGNAGIAGTSALVPAASRAL